MGYMTELNTLIGLPKEFPTGTLQVNKTYTILKDRERTFPLHIAMLMVDSDWNLYGYAVVDSLYSKSGKSTLEFTVLSLFDEAEKKLYKEKFVFAARQTGEVS